MKTFRFFSIIIFLVFASAVFAQLKPSVVPAAGNAREYLPGDFVHVVVDAPIDTAQISAVMPDNTTISLVQERRSAVWRGIWQVPVDFKKGTYAAKLSAVDLEGNVFEGLSDTFAVGELAMITLVGKSTKEAAAIAKEQPPLSEKITPIPPGTLEAQILNVIRKLIVQPVEAPVPELKTSEKVLLVDRNIRLGRENLEAKKYSEAAAYLRIVLYLDPKQKEAGLLLVEAQEKIAQAERQRQLNIILFASFAVIVLVLIYPLIRNLFRKPVVVVTAPAAPPQLSDNEKREIWFKKFNWKGNPFSADVLAQLFSPDSKLEIEGLKTFIKTRIEASGGSGFLPFTDTALEEAHAFSKGNTKTALKICAWAVEQAIRQDEDKITAELIKAYSKFTPAKILIADDEEIIRSSLDLILKKGGGYETDFALDGEETIKKIQANNYGLVLLDVAMPKIDGYEVLRQVRAVYPGLPIVFVTGKGIPQKTIESLEKYDLNGYIEKPFTPEKVLDVVAKALKIR